MVPALRGEEPPAKIKSHDGHPGKGSDEGEVAKVADERARIAADEDARLDALLCAFQVECGGCDEVEEEKEDRKKSGGDNVDEDDLASKVVVARDEPVDEESESETY